MNKAEIIEEIESELGLPVVNVELKDNHYDQIIRKSLRWFRARKNLILCEQIPLTKGQGSYPYPENVDEVLDVAFPKGKSSGGIANVFDLGFFDGITPATGVLSPSILRFDISSYIQIMQNLEMRQRVYSSDAGWINKRDTREILVTNANISGMMHIWYKPSTVLPEDLVGRDEELFQRYCLALAKKVLGRILRKYTTYPAAGGPITTDGPELINEGNEEILVLNEEIYGSQGNYGGIVIG